MKVTKAQLKQIIKEELEAVTEQDAQAMMVRGAKGAGRDAFSVEKIRINPDGTFKARLKSAQLEKPLRVAGDLDHNSLALLHQAGALEKAKGPVEPKSPIHKELMDTVGVVVALYKGAELPPAVGELKALIDAADLQKARDEVTNIWNSLLKYHQQTGTRLQHKVTTTFNTINTLLRKLD
jgi:hypothetical protein